MAFERLNGTLRRLFGRLRIEAGRSGKSTDAALSVNQDSGNAGLLMNLQVDGSSKFNVDKNGNARLYDYNALYFGNANYAYLHAAHPTANLGLKLILNGKAWNFDDYGIYHQEASIIGGFYANGGSAGYAKISHNLTSLQIIGTKNLLELLGSTNPQVFNIYATYTSDTSYHRMALTCAKKTLSNVSGATVSTTGGLIPAGAFLMGVTTRINTTLGTGNGTTGYAVGDGVDPNLWGDVTAITAGTASKAQAIADQSSGYTAADACGLYTAAQDVTLTAAGGNFDGTGVIEVSAFYFLTEAD